MKHAMLLTLAAASIGLTFPTHAAIDPYAQPDNSWISLTGTVTSVDRDSFRLDYGKGMVTVEMNDWSPDAEGYEFLNGDEVTVYGLVDDDFFEKTTIEASSVYVKGLNTYFYASSADEEDIPAAATVGLIEYDVEIRGTVTRVIGRKFMIDTGDREMRVDTIEMDYNPLDDEGYQRVEVGDRVSVVGNIDYNWWDKREIEAETIVTLMDSGF